MRNQNRLLFSTLVAALTLGAGILNQEPVAAQAQGPTVTVNGTVATTQSGTWTVNLAEAPYFYSVAPTCDFENRCSVTFPAVPAGAILRVKRLHGIMFHDSFDAFVSLSINSSSSGTVFAFPLPHFDAAFSGDVLSFNTDTEVVFTAGQSPVLVIGTSPANTFATSPFNRLGITGTLSAAPQ